MRTASSLPCRRGNREDLLPGKDQNKPSCWQSAALQLSLLLILFRIFLHPEQVVVLLWVTGRIWTNLIDLSSDGGCANDSHTCLRIAYMAPHLMHRMSYEVDQSISLCSYNVKLWPTGGSIHSLWHCLLWMWGKYGWTLGFWWVGVRRSCTVQVCIILFKSRGWRGGWRVLFSFFGQCGPMCSEWLNVWWAICSIRLHRGEPSPLCTTCQKETVTGLWCTARLTLNKQNKQNKQNTVAVPVSYPTISYRYHFLPLPFITVARLGLINDNLIWSYSISCYAMLGSAMPCYATLC